jgi:hypothetical protein
MWKYLHNSGGFIVGIPARDLTDEEVNAMSAVDQQTVKTCGLYKQDEPRKDEEVKPTIKNKKERVT